MSEYKQAISDIERFVDELIHAANSVYPALVDLKSNLAFYTEGESAGCRNAGPSGASEPAANERCEAATSDAGGRVQDESLSAHDEAPGAEKVKRKVVSAKPDHLYKYTLYHDRVPTTEHAWKILGSRSHVRLSDYYKEFDKLISVEQLATITRIGMRYLAHCCGYKCERLWTGDHGYQTLIKIEK